MELKQGPGCWKGGGGDRNVYLQELGVGGVAISVATGKRGLEFKG